MPLPSLRSYSFMIFSITLIIYFSCFSLCNFMRNNKWNIFVNLFSRRMNSFCFYLFIIIKKILFEEPLPHCHLISKSFVRKFATIIHARPCIQFISINYFMAPLMRGYFVFPLNYLRIFFYYYPTQYIVFFITKNRYTFY